MQILSALDAVSPSFSRTKLVLFSPFRKGRTWKLCATAYLGMAGSLFFPFPLLVFFFLPKIREAGGATVEWIAITAAIVVTLVILVFFYLFTRLRFASFDIVLNRGEFVAPAWNKYGPQAFKWTVFKAVLGTVALAILAVPGTAFVTRFIATVSALKPGEQPPPEFVFGLMSGYLGIYLVFGLCLWASSLLSDFIVPSLALEDTTLGEAFRRLGLLVRNEPGQVALYAVLKLALAFAFIMGATLGFEILFVIILLIAALIAGLIGLLLHVIGVPLAVLYVLGGIVAFAFYIFFIFYGVIIVNGTVMTFLESYSLYFLGGRYPMLGHLLTASTPPTPTVSPLYPDPYPPYSAPPPPSNA
jgi:hypothetical protein